MKKLIMTCICVATLSSVVAQEQDLPEGALPGEFNIGEGKTVRFSQGNLVYDQTTESFSFAETQTAYGSYFGWGTSGYHDPNDDYNIHYQPWDETITYEQSKANNVTGYGPSLVGTVAPSICWNGILGSRYANYDWGIYNPITNGGNTAGLWRTLTKEEWIYLLTNNPHEMKTIGEVSGLQITATDGSTVFLPAAGYRGLGSKSATSGTYTPAMYEVNTNCNYWSSSAVGDDKGLSAYSIDYSEKGPNYNVINYNRFNGFSVRLVMDVNPVDGAWITISDKADNSELLAKYKENGDGSYKGVPVNVHIIRSLTPGMSNTLTLPFDVAESEMEAFFGTGYELLQLKEDDPGSINVEAQEFAVNLLNATSIEAGVPYLITPTQAVNNMHFINRIIQRATNEECIAGADKLVEFHGLLDKTKLTAGDKSCLFLYPNNTLVWSAENDNSSMNSLRAYFKVNAPAGAPLRNFAPRMVVTSPSVTTDNSHLGVTIGDSRTIAGTAHKIMKDGQLMIVRDTIVLNLFGQRIK